METKTIQRFDVELIDYNQDTDRHTLRISDPNTNALLIENVDCVPLANGEGLAYLTPIEPEWSLAIRNAIWSELDAHREYNPESFETLGALFAVCTPSGEVHL